MARFPKMLLIPLILLPFLQPSVCAPAPLGSMFGKGVMPTSVRADDLDERMEDLMAIGPAGSELFRSARRPVPVTQMLATADVDVGTRTSAASAHAKSQVVPALRLPLCVQSARTRHAA